MLAIYILSRVCLRLSRCSQLSFMHWMGLCTFSLPVPSMMIVRICVLHIIIIIKSKVWPISHCFGLGNEKWYALSFYILTPLGVTIINYFIQICERDAAKFHLRNRRMWTIKYIVMTRTGSTFMEHYVGVIDFYCHKLEHHLNSSLVFVGYPTRLYVTAHIHIKHLIPWKLKANCKYNDNINIILAHAWI